MEKKLDIYEAEGLDTINFQLELFDEEKVVSYIKEHGKKIENGITVKLFEGFNFINNTPFPICEIHVQAEALDMRDNIWNQLSDIVFKLYDKGICYLPFAKVCKNNSEVKIKITFLLNYIIKLTRVDFHFDFIKDDITLLNSMEFKDKKTNEVSYTSYSKDGKKIHQSHWIAYNRQKRLLKVNQMKKEEIANMERVYRIEYRLKSKNNKYLNLINLGGNFLWVFWLFKDVIARSWRDRGHEIANVKTNPFRNPLFSVILQEAESGNIIKNNPALKRKEKIERDNLSYYVHQDKPVTKEPMLIDLAHTLKGND